MDAPREAAGRIRTWSRDPFVFGLFLAVFLACYLPVLNQDYGFHDDYPGLVQGPEGWPITKKMLEGRPFMALAQRGFLQVADGIEDLRYARLAGVLGIVLVAWIVFRTLVRAGWNRFQSFCVGVIACSTLPFQVYAAWATIAVGPFAAAASGLAFFLADRAFDAHPFRRKILLVAGAALTQFAAFTIYQPAAMFFWVPAAIVLLQPKPPPHLLRRFGWYCLILLIGMLAGYAAVKLPAILYPPSDVSQRSALVRDLPAKAMWFLGEPLPQALTFFWLSPGRLLSELNVVSSWKFADRVVAYGILVFIASGLMAYFRREPEYAGWRWAIAAILLPMIYLPNLAVEKSWASYRTLSSLSSLLVVYAYIACDGHARLLSRLHSRARGNAVMAAAATACALSAAYHVNTFFVAPQVRELAFLRSRLEPKVERLSQTLNIGIIPSSYRDTLAPFVRYDEFGKPSSSIPWTARSMVLLLVRDLDSDADVSVTIAGVDEKPVDPPDLVIDMGEMALQPGEAGRR